jgi:sulfate adenylyltransferase
MEAPRLRDRASASWGTELVVSARSLTGVRAGLPHGGVLVDRRLDADQATELGASGLPWLPLGAAEAADLRTLATGAYSPLVGFMGTKQHQSVTESMRLPDGTLWPIPICLGLPNGTRVDGHVLLRGPDGELAGVLEVEEVFDRDWQAEAELVYGTSDPAHPGVARILGAPPLAVAGLLLHPLVGPTKEGDVPAEVRMRAYEAVLGYFPSHRVLLAALVAPMRYAGPREAVLHALVRKNYGCTHFIVGRDHAGVGSYYGTFQAQELIASLAEDELGITPLRFDNAFYCRVCLAMATGKTCPHPDDDHVALSGTQVRAMLAGGELPPAEFSRPEVARLLIDAYQS